MLYFSEYPMILLSCDNATDLSLSTSLLGCITIPTAWIVTRIALMMKNGCEDITAFKKALYQLKQLVRVFNQEKRLLNCT